MGVYTIAEAEEVARAACRVSGTGVGDIKPLLLGVVAILIPAAIALGTIVLFATFPLSSFVAVLIGVAFSLMLSKESPRFMALCAVPSLLAAVVLLFVPLEEFGRGPMLSRLIALNIAVFLLTVGVIRWKQGVRTA